jgi:hypothetical protein
VLPFAILSVRGSPYGDGGAVSAGGRGVFARGGRLPVVLGLRDMLRRRLQRAPASPLKTPRFATSLPACRSRGRRPWHGGCSVTCSSPSGTNLSQTLCGTSGRSRRATKVWPSSVRTPTRGATDDDEHHEPGAPPRTPAPLRGSPRRADSGDLLTARQRQEKPTPQGGHRPWLGTTSFAWRYHQ